MCQGVDSQSVFLLRGSVAVTTVTYRPLVRSDTLHLTDVCLFLQNSHRMYHFTVCSPKL